MDRNHTSPEGYCDEDGDLFNKVRLLGKDGKQIGIMMLFDAMKIAEKEQAKLVNLTPHVLFPAGLSDGGFG